MSNINSKRAEHILRANIKEQDGVLFVPLDIALLAVEMAELNLSKIMLEEFQKVITSEEL